jgi:hypothetical protein
VGDRGPIKSGGTAEAVQFDASVESEMTRYAAQPAGADARPVLRPGADQPHIGLAYPPRNGVHPQSAWPTCERYDRFTIDVEGVAMSNPVESGAAAESIRPVGRWQVPGLGAGTWALGGPWEFAGAPAGWSEVDDEVSIAAVRAA